MSTFRESARADWQSGNKLEDINAGSLQRIADAVEKMAASYDQVRSERDRYKRWYEEEQAKSARLRRSIISLRGVITKLKARLVAGETNPT